MSSASGPGAESSPGAEQDPGPTPAAARPKRSARAVFCSAVVTIEIFVVWFAALVAFGLRDTSVSVAPIWGTAAAVALLAIAAAATVTRPIGVWLGSAVQVALILGGLVVPMMLGIGIIFAVIWVVAIGLGRRIDRERAERAAAEARLGS